MKLIEDTIKNSNNFSKTRFPRLVRLIKEPYLNVLDLCIHEFESAFKKENSLKDIQIILFNLVGLYLIRDWLNTSLSSNN